MIPEQLPQWLDYALSENTAVAMFRGLQGLSARWGELIATAQAVMGVYQDLPMSNIESLYDEQNVLPLIAASRILDTASHPSTGLPEEDRRYLAIAAAVAFAMYGNFPSATAAVRRILPTFPVDSPSLAVIFATAAPSHLGEMLEHCPSDSPQQSYLERLQAFLATGEVTRIEAIREALIKCLLAAATPFEGALLRSTRLCLEHLFRLSVARTLHEQCPLLPEVYIQQLIDSGVRVLLPPQFKAITQHNLLTSSANALVALPTSTGKTLLGELCLMTALQQHAGVVCYLAPYVALGTQVARALAEHLPASFRIHRMLGGFREETHLATTSHSDIIVATPERLDAMLRTTPGLITALRCVVCDEAHLIQNDVRGVRLEGLLTRMRLVQEQGHPLRLVLLSAVLSQYDALRQWLGASTTTVVTDTWRPTARRLAVWRESGNLAWYMGDDPIRRAGTGSDSIIGQLTLPWPHHGFYPTKHVGQIRQQEPLVHANVAYLAEVLWRRYEGSILCVCATKDGTRKVAAAVAERFPIIEPLPPRITSTIAHIETHHPFLRPMCDLLKRGVAFHNSTVPHAIRLAIEEAVQQREILAVAATTTLAEGVDLPFRFTILVDWLTWQGTEQRPIPSLLFRNVAGRCGRAYVFTEGDTIVFDNPLGELKYTSPYTRTQTQHALFLAAQPEELTSALERFADTSPPAQTESLAAGLASQFMAAIPENPNNDQLVEAFAERTFLAHRLGNSEMLRQRLTPIVSDLLNSTHEAFATAASPLRLTPFGLAANATGFSPQSCRHIVAFLQEHRIVEEGEEEDLTVLASALLRRLGTLTEQTNQNLRKVLSAQKSHFAVKPSDFRDVLHAWLAKRPPEEIFSVLPYVQRSRKTPTIAVWLAGSGNAPQWDTEFDKFMDFTSAVFGGFLPWLMRACGRLSLHTGGWATHIPWQQWAQQLENRLDPASPMEE